MKTQPSNALILFLLASACAASGPAANQAAASGQDEFPSTLAQMTEAEFNLYYPREYFLQYPPQVRELIRRNLVESAICEGNYPDERERFRACNRRYRVLLELEQVGWCWGGSKTGISADEHWLPCSEDPYYRTHRLSRRVPFPEVE